MAVGKANRFTTYSCQRITRASETALEKLPIYRANHANNQSHGNSYILLNIVRPVPSIGRLIPIYKGKSLKRTAIILKSICHKIDLFALFDAYRSIRHYIIYSAKVEIVAE